MTRRTYKQATSHEELSKLIIAAIEEEQFFNKAVLIPRIKAIFKAFRLNLAVSNYNKETPTDAAKRLRSLEIKTFEKTFWHRRYRADIGEDKFNAACRDLAKALKESGLE